MPFINKTLKNGHIKRSSIRNKCLQNRSDSKKIGYNRLQSYFGALWQKNKQTKKRLRQVKQFWRTVNSLSSHKIRSSEKVFLLKRKKLYLMIQKMPRY